MKKQLLLLAVVGGALAVAAPQVHAQNGTQFTPGATGGTGAQNPDGSFVHPTGLAQDGNPNQFSVVGTIDEFIRITAIDDLLELGNLGGPTLGNSTTPATAYSATISANPLFAKNISNSITVPQTNVGENGSAGVEFESNSYIKTIATYGPNLLNPGPDGNPLTTNDNYTLPTFFRNTARGKYRVSATGTPGDLSLYTTSPNGGANYANYFMPAAAGLSRLVNFAPGYGSGSKFMAQITRRGLNDYRGSYTTSISMSYFKF